MRASDGWRAGGGGVIQAPVNFLLHIDTLKDQKDAHLKIKNDGTFRHNFRALGEARHNLPCRAYVEPIFAVERRGQPH